MKILFLTMFPLKSINSHSGVNDYLFSSILKKFPDSKYGCPSKIHKSAFYSLYNRIAPFINNKKVLPIHENKSVIGCCSELQTIYDSEYPNLIITTTPLCLTFLDFSCPAIVYTDATIPSMLDYYPQFTDVRKESVISASKLELIGFEKAKHLFFASKWAAESAINSYSINPGKVTVIPRPRNLSSSLNHNQVISLINQRFHRPKKHFLFVGVDWQRKGGDIAYNIVRDLGAVHDVVLDVVGVVPKSFPKSSIVNFHGFLDKSNVESYHKLKHLYESSFAFILPTKAEAMGISFNEAASYALPLVANNTGGVSTIVNNKNGFFINELGYHTIITSLTHLLLDFSYYSEISMESFKTSESLPTWDEALKIMIGKL